jgi:large subunit ribosomal protein L18
MDKNKHLDGQRERRRFRVRKRIRGSAMRPRLSVYRSHRNLACQIIDDASGKTLVAVGTKDKDVRTNVPYGGCRRDRQAACRKSEGRGNQSGRIRPRTLQVSWPRGGVGRCGPRGGFELLKMIV